jgi:hypothetical protein
MAAALEDRLQIQIELDCDDAENFWKVSGAWRGSSYSFLRFRCDSARFNDVYVKAPPEPPPLAEDYVYFIDDGERIKIGRAQDPLQRMQALQTGIGKELALLLAIPNGNLEGLLHQKFAGLRVRGEWFRKEEPLLGFIEEKKREQAG